MDSGAKDPTVILEQGAIGQISRICDKHGLKNGVIVSEQGIIQKIVNDCFRYFLPYIKSDRAYIIEKADYQNVIGLENFIRQNKIDFVGCMGGGTVIDVGKFAAYRAKVPWISIPTAASHDGIVSNRVSIRDSNNRVNSSSASLPIGVLADIDIIGDPKAQHLAAAGVGDIMAKITADHDWRLGKEVNSEEFNEQASKLTKKAVETVSKNIGDFGTHEFIRCELKALIDCGKAMCMTGSSRPASGSEHLFSHAIDKLSLANGFSPSLHGYQCGLGTLVCKHLQSSDSEEIEKIRRVLDAAGVPTTSKAIGIESRWLIKALGTAKDIRKERYTILHHKNIGEKEAQAALKAVKIIK